MDSSVRPIIVMEHCSTHLVFVPRMEHAPLLIHVHVKMDTMDPNVRPIHAQM
jgi:hypothetical protein